MNDEEQGRGEEPATSPSAPYVRRDPAPPVRGGRPEGESPPAPRAAAAMKVQQLPSFWGLTGRSIGPIVGYGSVALLSFVCLGLGFLVVGWVAASLVFAILAKVPTRHADGELKPFPRRRSFLSGLFLQVLGFALLGGLALGMTGVEALGLGADEEQAYALVAPLISAVGALLLAPLLFAPLVRMDAGMPEGLSASLAAATLVVQRLGTLRTARVALAIVLWTIGPFALMVFLAVDGPMRGGHAALTVILSMISWAFSFGFAGVVLTRAYAQVRDEVVTELGDRAKIEHSLSKPLFATTALTTLALLGAYVATLVEPLPVRVSYQNPPAEVHEAFAGGHEVELPSGVLVSTTRGGVNIVAPDGGGHGFLRWDGYADPQHLWLVSSENGLHRFAMATRYPRPQMGETWPSDVGPWGEFVIDDDGVRIGGDGVGARAEARLGPLGSALTLLVLLGWAWFLIGALPPLVRAQYVGAATALASVAGAPGRRMLEGRLELRDATLGFSAGGTLFCEGDAFVVTPDARFRLPAEVPYVGTGERVAFTDGERVTLFAHFEKVGTELRGVASLPWPRKGRLAAGAAVEVADALARRAAQRVSLALGFTLLAAGIALAYAFAMLA